jgi:hypothetical protein
MSGLNVVTLQGALLAGPPRSSCNGFPAGIVNTQFELRPPNKSAAVSTGMQVRNLNSPSSYATLSGVGSDDAVTQGSFLYIRTQTSMLFRLTTNDTVDVVSVIPVDGLCIIEFPAGKYLELLEAQGVGVVEYFASGSQ